MVYRFRVSIPGIKAFTRVYEVRDNVTLFQFHKNMRNDMEFPQDQLIQFKALDDKDKVVARYGLFDLGSGSVDEVHISDAVANGICAFQYFYDVPGRKSVMVTLEGEVEQPQTKEPVALVESKGPEPAVIEINPAAYAHDPEERSILWAKEEKEGKTKERLAFDDDDFDDLDDEEDDDDEAEEIFDGTEELGI